LSTERRPIRCARDDVDFRIVGFKLSAPNQPAQTLVALAYVGKARDGVGRAEGSEVSRTRAIDDKG
jgi:hypothetical protein